MHQPPPDKAEDDEESAIEHRFAELMRRFWHRPERSDPLSERDPK